MEKFINSYLQKELASNPNLFIGKVHVLPSRRAINYFKKELSRQVDATLIVPEMYSIEDFIQKVASIEVVNSLQLAFSFYNVYKSVVPEQEKESFDVVYNWSQVLLQDFNEIDRYLVDVDRFFSNLSAVKDLEHWSMTQQPTEMLQKYLNFWKQMPLYYKAFSSYLLSNNIAYQGLAYRKASEEFANYAAASDKQFVFLGFNALNAAEQNIFQEVIRQKKGEIVWDVDKHFLANSNFGVASFLQSYAKNWDVYKEAVDTIQPSTNTFTSAKKIRTYATAKQVGQAKIVAQLLQEMSPEQIKETAVVLGDEALLPVLLNHLPEKIQTVNITMGLPLSKTPFASFFDQLIVLHSKAKETWFVKDLFQLIEHVFITHIAPTEVKAFKQELIQQKRFFLTTEEVLEKSIVFPLLNPLLELMLAKENALPEKLLSNFLSLITQVKKEHKKHTLFTEYAFYYNAFFEQLLDQLNRQETITQLGIFHQLYKDTIALETLDFEGMPFEGLQVMGMLETRLLDYKNIIVTSVNEGILPAGKSVNSYIPFDLKVAFGLPTYKEKDAVYSYHFFRLLQRAKNIHLIYNNDASGMDKAEPSRFLLQLKTFASPLHDFSEKIWAPLTPTLQNNLISIPKTPEIIAQIKTLFRSGVSPSALTTYIRNPIDFYKRYVLKIQEEDAFEEEVSYRIYGNIIHKILEDLYKPFVGEQVTKDIIKEMEKKLPSLLNYHFITQFSAQGLERGTNLISTHIASRQIQRFLAIEKNFIAQHNVVIKSLEQQQLQEFKLNGIDFLVRIKGIADRVDVVNNNTLRIIDYKTGKVESKDLRINEDLGVLITDFKFSKAFQVLTYALFFEDQLSPQTAINSGILSFKNLNGEYLWLEYAKNKAIEASTLTEFKQVLSCLLSEILDINHPFEEKTL